MIQNIFFNALLSFMIFLFSDPIACGQSKNLRLRTADDPFLSEEIARNAALLKKDPYDFVAYYYRGRAFMEERKFSLAEGDFYNAIKVNPYRENIPIQKVKADRRLNCGRIITAWCYQNLGFMHFQVGQFAKGIAETTKAIDLRPNYAGNYKNRAVGYEKIGRADLARVDIAKCEQILKEKPDDDCKNF